MGRVIGPPIHEREKAWLLKQHVFFTGSAPLSAKNRVNVSPKSAKEFRVVDEKTVCWLDYTGSGSETAAHIMENGRLTIMFVSFEGPPKIIRFHGMGRLITPSDAMLIENKPISDLFEGELIGQRNYSCGFRCIIVMDVNRVSQSCGFSIPEFTYTRDRKTLREFTEEKGTEKIKEYRGLKNSFSIDGLKSVGQLETGRIPTSVNLEGGYYFAQYGERNFMGEMMVCAMMSWRNGKLHAFLYTVAVFLSGVIAGIFSVAAVSRPSSMQEL
mmetsp:Transcript_21700/g.31579  ORF Transcript_21700/g.31579 Transcript_21700/m.31579 type:complete len:270 (+) Transcript_21700:112-921(+)|eukprot:CAMPEP_0185024390 /NCGR_PEP_ID=MMETSP1103-20130426/7439_1 /TAXON_ID=36769 /ORGANISM="Paraphysomonas bandaiensis, Strain Caron Lab Isolate" /LENGTH=269 /DNA_ID=CAMNT_0027557341 /DNA_START=106 /DNA_END=915 /DNA_ORIENTATION=+